MTRQTDSTNLFLDAIAKREALLYNSGNIVIRVPR
jgi:hypothetical protein